MDWISVKDRLPDIGSEVIATGLYYDKRARAGVVVYKGKDDGVEDWWSTDGILKVTATVTHWMPLPDPPKP